MFKRITVALLGLVVLIGVLAGIKGFQINRMTASRERFVPPPEVVTTAEVTEESWESLLTAVGSLEAVQGVSVTAELSGKVTHIAFTPGTKVTAGSLLLQQDISVESAQLRAAEAAVDLAKINLKRLRELIVIKSISQSEFDNAEAQYKEAVAQADNIRAIISKKTIRAPFSGRLGIKQVDLGQVIGGGDVIVSLQSLDPIYANFSLPQQQLARIRPGLTVQLTTDALPDQVPSGKITAINPQVEAASRNIRIQATVENPKELLRPGMYVDVSVVLPGLRKVLAIPATSVLYAPYGNSVFVVEEKGNGEGNDPGLQIRQKFVRLGKKQGDFISVLTGLKPKEIVVSTGVFKLRNGQSVVVDNRLSPEFKKSPAPSDA